MKESSMSSGMTEPSPNRRRGAAVPSAIVGVVVVLMGTGAAFLARARAKVDHVALADTPQGVTVVRAKPTTYRPTRRFVGTVEPWVSSRVGPQIVSAYVGSVLVRPGDVVKRGDVLATLDCQEQAAQSQAVAAQARALEEREKAIAGEAARVEQLSQNGYVSANDLDRHKAQQAESEAQIQALRAELAGKGLAVGDCVMRAPFDGEIGARLLDPGSYVHPGSTVVTVVDRRMLRITADAPEVDSKAVGVATPVRLRLLALGTERSAVVARRAPSADPSTRTVHFEIDMERGSLEVPVGTTAEITVDVGDPVDVTEIPLIAAKVRGDKANVFVVDRGIAKAKAVAIVGEREGSLFVARELGPDAMVVTEGRGLLRDGESVAAREVQP